MTKRPRGLGKRSRLTTKVLRRLLRFLAYVRFVRVVVNNRQVVPASGPVIIVCNHISLLDILFLWGALRRPAVAIAMAELWSWPIVGWLVRLLGQIPVVRRDPVSGKNAIEAAERVLEHDGAFIIFGEGKCVSPGDKEPFKPGVARIAWKTGVLVVPAGIRGANNVLPLERDRTSNKKFFRTERVEVNFGTLINPKDFASEAALLAKIEESVRELAVA